MSTWTSCTLAHPQDGGELSRAVVMNSHWRALPAAMIASRTLRRRGHAAAHGDRTFSWLTI